jgi:hypothetical protein
MRRETLDQRGMEAQIWRTLSTALLGLSSLPDPKEVVKICRAHVGRTRITDEKLMASLTWLEEFSDAWTK